MAAAQRPGPDLERALVRLSNAHHVLRELVHRSLGWLALEPRFDVKALLAEHAYDDARGVSRIARRLIDLRTSSEFPGAPGGELAALLDRAAAAQTAGAYLDVAYGIIKPALVAALEAQLRELDALVEEPSVRLVVKLVHRQERHLMEMGMDVSQAQERPLDIGLSELRLRGTRTLTVSAPVEHPAREPFVEVEDASDAGLGRATAAALPVEPAVRGRFLHDLLNEELVAAELTARSAHEHPDMPWDFHVDMARQCWDELRHAQVLDRVLGEEELGAWGVYPVGFDHFRRVYRHDLLGRLALFDATSGRVVIGDPAMEPLAGVFSLLRADEAPHLRGARRWGAHLLGGDMAQFRERARVLRQADPALR